MSQGSTFEVTFDHRHENKSCLACPKSKGTKLDNLTTWLVPSVCLTFSFNVFLVSSHIVIGLLWQPALMASSKVHQPVGAPAQNARSVATGLLCYDRTQKIESYKYEIKFIGSDTSQELAQMGLYRAIRAGVNCVYDI